MWVYDLRTNMPAFGKRTPLTRAHFSAFEKAFGKDSRGQSKRYDQGESGRFRRFSRDHIRAREENLNLTWLKDEDSTNHDDLPQPEILVSQVLEKLRSAVDEMQELKKELA